MYNVQVQKGNTFSNNRGGVHKVKSLGRKIAIKEWVLPRHEYTCNC